MAIYSSVFRENLFRASEQGSGGIYLITGGGTGIGRCIAHELASLGARVVVVGRRLELLERTCNEINAQYGINTCVARVVNIRDEKGVNKAVEDITSKIGPIVGLVNNAGGQFVSPAENISANGWRAVIDLNVNGTWNVTKAVFNSRTNESVPLSIVTILADVVHGKPYMAHTSAARAALWNLTLTLAQEWGPRGVRINAVCPGTIIGNGMSNYPPATRELTSALHNQNPTGRFGTEAEISSVVVFLLSKGAAYVNGAVVQATGGAHLQKGPEIPNPFPDQSAIPPYFGFTNLKSDGVSKPGYLGDKLPVEFEGLFNLYTKMAKL